MPLFTATAVTLALGGAGYAASVLLGSGTTLGEASRTPLVAASNLVTAFAAFGLALQIPGAWGVSRGARIPAAIVALGVAFLGAFAFALATVVPHFGTVVADDAVFSMETPWQDLLGWPKQVLLLVGLGWLAIAARRSGSIGSVGAAAVLLAALVNAMLWPYAPGAIALGLTFAIVRPKRR